MATSIMVPVLVPLSEYMTTSYEPDCEWIDGELKERTMGEGSHATIQTFFIKFFSLREQIWNIRVTQELRTQVKTYRFRVPDVVVLHANAPFEEIVTTPPLLCVEILSPDDRASDLQDKIDDYLAMGVTAIWVINPRLRKVFDVQNGGLMPVETLTVPGTPIQISAPEVFAELDRLQARKEI